MMNSKYRHLFQLRKTLHNMNRPSSSIIRIPSPGVLNRNFDGKLNDKVAIVTAATQGIGYSIAEKLGFEGCNLSISSRKQENVDDAIEKLSHARVGAMGLTCNVGREDDRENLVKETVKAFGGIDYLVCNAGINPAVGGVLQCPDNVWDKIFDINLKSTWKMIQQVVPEMRKREGGSIVIISSIAGLNPFELLGTYSVSKTALLGLTKTLAKELAQDNIRVNCVSPGLVRTKFSEMLFSSGDYIDQYINNIPLKRAGEPRDIGGAVSFLLSDDSAYITGENIVVSGGLESRL